MYVFYVCNNYCSSHPFISKFGMGKILEVGNSKVTLRRLKNKSVLRYLRFQVLSTRFSVTGPVPKNTCDQIIEKKNCFFSFHRYQPIIKPKTDFGSLLDSSK